MLILSLVSSLALAGDLQVTRSAGPSVHVFVDGARVGEVSRKEPLSVPVDDGVHELLVADDPGAFTVICYGLADVSGSFAFDATVDGCRTLTAGTGARSALRGATLLLTGVLNSEATTFYVDGTKVSSGWVNVSPGRHTVVVGVALGTALCAGTITLDPGERSVFTVAGARSVSLGQYGGLCAGFDGEVHQLP